MPTTPAAISWSSGSRATRFICGRTCGTRKGGGSTGISACAALKDARWIVVPTLFVPLEDTRLEKKGAQSAKIVELTDLQWEFFFTCWRYNLDFYHRRPATMAKFALGIPLYYTVIRALWS